MLTASRPGRDTTRRLMSRGRLRTRKAARRNLPLPRAVAPNLAIRRRPREDRRPLNGTVSPLDEFGLTDIRSLRHRHRARAAWPTRRQAHRLRQKRWPGWDEIARPRPPRPPEPPEGVPGTTPMLARARERLPPAKLPEEPRQPGSERRSRAGRERRSPPKNTEARRPTELFEPAAEPGRSRDPTAAAEPRSR